MTSPRRDRWSVDTSGNMQKKDNNHGYPKNKPGKEGVAKGL